MYVTLTTPILSRLLISLILKSILARKHGEHLD